MYKISNIIDKNYMLLYLNYLKNNKYSNYVTLLPGLSWNDSKCDLVSLSNLYDLLLLILFNMTTTGHLLTRSLCKQGITRIKYEYHCEP